MSQGTTTIEGQDRPFVSAEALLSLARWSQHHLQRTTGDPGCHATAIPRRPPAPHARPPPPSPEAALEQPPRGGATSRAADPRPVAGSPPGGTEAGGGVA